MMNVLQEHAARLRATSLRALFEQDAQRFERFSFHAAHLLLDLSKNLIDAEALAALIDTAKRAGVESRRDAMFSGERINNTEQRAAWHVALRFPRERARPEVRQVLQSMGEFCRQVHGKFTDVVNIGIGGSDLGSKMATNALKAFAHPNLRLHFVSSVDGHGLHGVLQKLQPSTTLFVVASKSFTTEETLANAHLARVWFTAQGGQFIDQHFVAVSTNMAAVTAFGIDPTRMFPLWDWVGGRYSLWSAIGLSVMLAIGPEHFDELLAGAHDMDEHFRCAPLAKNLPVLLAALDIWYRNYFGTSSRSIAPYDHRLRHFPAYLQQLDMESNGKSVQRDGTPVTASTGGVIWGESGTNGQHAYFQLLHQGTDLTPVDFIAVAQPAHPFALHHTRLLANCLAQGQALAFGKTAQEVAADMQRSGASPEDIARLLPHRVCPGNRPSTTLLLNALTPRSLGALIALYEHKVFVCGVLWNINSFDQWGVELGKALAQQIESLMQDKPGRADASTLGLIAYINAHRKNTT